MKLQSITVSTRPEKRYMATFSDGTITHFGFKGGSTFIDHKDEKKKDAYIARHKVNEDWTDPIKAGTLARYILWNKPTLVASVKDYKKRFGL